MSTSIPTSKSPVGSTGTSTSISGGGGGQGQQQQQQRGGQHEPYIAIFGATGAQGGSVLRSVLKAGGWWIKAITRDPNSEKARKLKQEHPEVEIEQCDMIDKQALKSVLSGCEAVFCVTDFYTERNQQKMKEGKCGELEEGCAVADVAKECGVKYFIYSSLMNCKDLSGGRYKVCHFTGKDLVDKHAREIGLNVITILAGLFMQNWTTGLFPASKEQNDGSIEWTMPLRHDVALPMLDVSHIGEFVSHILQKPDQWVNKQIFAAHEYLTVDEMAHIYSEVTGKNVHYHRLSIDEYLKENKSVAYADDFAQMFQFFNEFGYYNGESLEPTRQEFGIKHSWRDFVECTWGKGRGKVAEPLTKAAAEIEPSKAKDIEQKGEGKGKMSESAKEPSMHKVKGQSESELKTQESSETGRT